MEETSYYTHLPQIDQSEGEEFISLFLEDEKIDYETEVVMPLKNDNKRYRKADFYLPDYKVYIEYCGLWNNSKDDRSRYKEKMALYRANKVPCIFLFPDNLGTLSYTFDTRLKRVLREMGMKKELFRYNILSFLEDIQYSLLWITLAGLGLYMVNYDVDPETNIYYIGGGSIIVFYHLYQIYLSFKGIFKNTK